MATHGHTFTRQTVWFPKRPGFYCTETCKIELGRLSGPTKASINLVIFVAISGQKPPSTAQFPSLLALCSGGRYQKYTNAKCTRDLRCIRSVDVERLALSWAPFFFLLPYQMSLYSLRIQYQIQMQNLDLAPLVHCQQYLSWTHFGSLLKASLAKRN